MEGLSENGSKPPATAPECQRIAEHGPRVEFSRGLIQPPESFHIIGVEFE
jgi:hypothetical protein